MRALEIAPGDRRPHRRGEDAPSAGPCTARRCAREPDAPARARRCAIAGRIRHRHRRAEGDERARSVADRVAHHLGQLPRERPLLLLHPLPREDVILEHEVVGDRGRDDHQVAPLGRQRGMNQPGFRRLQLAAVASPALRIEEQVVLLQDLGDVGLEGDQVRRILGVAPDRNRAGDVAVDQAERTAEQVDAGGDERRPDAVVVEDQRLDQVVGVALVVRRVDDAVAARPRRRRGADSRACARSSAESGRADAAARDRTGGAAWSAVRRGSRKSARGAWSAACAIAAAEVLDDLFAGQNSLGDVIQHGSTRTIARSTRLSVCNPAESGRSVRAARHTASANSEVDAVPPRSRVRTSPCREHAPERRHDAIGRRALVDVPQHQHRRQQQRRRVRQVLCRRCPARCRAPLRTRRRRRRDWPRRRRRGRRPARRTGPRRCRRTGSASPARRTAPGSSPGACRPRRRSSRRR